MAVTLVQARGDALDQGEGLRARERMEAQGSLPGGVRGGRGRGLGWSWVNSMENGGKIIKHTL